jgi:hypothetical protein
METVLLAMDKSMENRMDNEGMLSTRFTTDLPTARTFAHKLHRFSNYKILYLHFKNRKNLINPNSDVQL